MRDYVDLIDRLERADQAIDSPLGRTLYSAAAEAIRELKVIADKMTSLGADLEDQVAEQLEADHFCEAVYGVEGGSLEEVVADHPLSPQQVHRYHTLPDVWAVIFPELNRYVPDEDSWVLEEERVVRQFYSEEEAETAVEDFERRESQLAEGYEGL